jgi:transcriptional regulator with XRE-family HTH domain
MTRKYEPTKWERGMAARLQELRKAAGFSQSGLAREAGVPVTTLQGWERARRMPRLEAAIKLADALQITLDELVGRKVKAKK